MTLPVFVVEPAALQGDQIKLAGPEGRHAATVQRTRVGQRVLLTDGLGRGAECQVVAAGKDWLDCAVVVRREALPAVPRLTVVQAIPKGEHADRAVDLLTEIGVDVIVPWAAARNVVQWRGDKAAKGLARWRSGAVAAAKQSRRLRFPDVQELQSTAEVASLLAGAGLAVVLHESAAFSLAELVVGEIPDAVVVVGPEGGLTEAELAEFEAAGAVVAGMGPTVLRSSSAGVVAASVLLSRTDRWRRTRA